ncbi:HIT-like superfamily [Sesbania bispinosa]|nr:HIT-like superfamily [Sesbania bispinosa]
MMRMEKMLMAQEEVSLPVLCLPQIKNSLVERDWYAQLLFDGMPVRDVVHWNVVMKANVELCLVDASASISHSHSQMLALSIIPPSVSARLGSMKDHFDQTGKCCICEIQCEDFLIDSSTYFFSLVLFAMSFTFEIWIVPRYHFAHFHELDAKKSVDLRGSMCWNTHIFSTTACSHSNSVDVLLDLEKQDKLSDSNMITVLWEMLFSGTDSVAITLEWILARMVLHSEIQTKINGTTCATVLTQAILTERCKSFAAVGVDLVDMGVGSAYAIPVVVISENTSAESYLAVTVSIYRSKYKDKQGDKWA